MSIGRKQKARPTIQQCLRAPFGALLAGRTILSVEPGGALPPGAAPQQADAIVASWVLEDIVDYREAIRSWFAALAPGGRLAILVPHAFLYERQDALPSRLNPRQRRLYTVRSLAEEIEEALEPNSYRIRWLGDDDTDYDYTRSPEMMPVGSCHAAAVIERIDGPEWGLEGSPLQSVHREPPRFASSRTRSERLMIDAPDRILLLKLDHLGDFVMALPAFERLRALFPNAHVTVAVGSWNQSIAESTGLFDAVLAIDVYPRNSSEEEVDVRGKGAIFEQVVTAEYDLAIDLRTDEDARFLLRHVKARTRAGIGTKARFPYLDIFAPIDASRHDKEAASSLRLLPADFSHQAVLRKTEHAITFHHQQGEPDGGALIWGPYHTLNTGDYLFEPFIDVAPHSRGLLTYDIALDMESTGYVALDGGQAKPIAFRVATERANLEFRLHRIPTEPLPDFAFYGGRISKKGSEGVLHQTEYLLLLVELVAMRLAAQGTLKEVG